MARPSYTFGWVASLFGHSSPPNSVKTDGLDAKQLPAAWLNDWLVGLTAWVDGWLFSLGAKYLHTRLFGNWRVTQEWGASYGRPAWVMTANGSSGHVGFPRQQLQQTTEALGGAVMHLDIPPGARKLQSVSVRIKPATGGRVQVPGVMPHLRVIVTDKDGTAIAFGTYDTDDASATPESAVAGQITAYETAHSITIEDMDQAITPGTHLLQVQLYGETLSFVQTGGGIAAFVAGLEVRGATVTYEYELETDVVIGSALP